MSDEGGEEKTKMNQGPRRKDETKHLHSTYMLSHFINRAQLQVVKLMPFCIQEAN